MVSMSRTILSLLLLFPGAALAGEASLAPDGSDCAEAGSSTSVSEASSSHQADATGAGEAVQVPGVNVGGDVSDRLPTPSWRSFLPGMLR